MADWNLVFRVNKRFGSCSGLIFKSADLPVFNNVSGINVTNTTQCFEGGDQDFGLLFMMTLKDAPQISLPFNFSPGPTDQPAGAVN
jgi:hypothetical protein